MRPDPTPHIVFRTDASLQIGTGHVMRCLALADELRRRGAECEFVCRILPGHGIDVIERCGFRVRRLPIAVAESCAGPGFGHARWLGGISPETDAAESLAVLAGSPVDWLVVDHYALDQAWEQKLRAAVRKVMVVDDLADRPHDCDLLLDQNLGRDPSEYVSLVPKSCKLLCGPAFALLRPEFARLRSRSLEHRAEGELARILVTMGGVDKDNATGRVLDALASCVLRAEIKITVIMGSRAPWLEQVRRQASALPFAVEVMVDVEDMALRMAESDLAIGAAGSTSWERCCMGLPTALVVIAENQAPAYRNLVESGSGWGLGGPEDIALTLPVILEQLLNSPQNMCAASRAAASICDGRGLERVTTWLN